MEYGYHMDEKRYPKGRLGWAQCDFGAMAFLKTLREN